MKQDVEIELIEDFKHNIQSSMFNAETARNHALSNSSNKIIACITSINLSLYYMSIAKSLYLNNSDILKRPEIDDIINQYEVFIREISSNLSNDHSHQWTDIEYQSLAEKFDNSVVGCDKYYFNHD